MAKSEVKQCQNCKQDFVIEVEDFNFYEKMKVPAPTFCPKCRRIRRLFWRNDFYLYNRNCALCNKSFASIYAPNSGFKVLCPKCFHGDAWDPYSYGREYDPARSFIEQLVELYRNMPVLGIINDNDIASINCLYTNDVGFSKNCSMVFISWKVENVYNSVQLVAGKDLLDCLGVAEESSNTYDGVMVNKVAYCKSAYWCISCLNCMLCYDCRGCSDCFMSSGLRNKKYYFKNEPYSKEEYEKIVVSYQLHTRTGYEKAKKEFQGFLMQKPRKFAELQNCNNCTGTDLIRCKNTKDCNTIALSEDSRYLHGGVSYKTCYDCEIGGETELAYECLTPDQSYRSLVTIESWKNNNVSYSIDCHSAENLLGCVGIKKGEYSILNKRYSKGEYQVLSERIIKDMKTRGEYGEFLHSKFSPFGINETRALNHLDLTREEALAQGYKWQDEVQKTQGRETISQDDVPDSILDVSETIINEVLSCIKCQRNYKILLGELNLYRRLLVPIPTQCFFCRHETRQLMRGEHDLISRRCDCTQSNHEHAERCKNIFKTFLGKKENRPVYCETCYQKELI